MLTLTVAVADSAAAMETVVIVWIAMWLLSSGIVCLVLCLGYLDGTGYAAHQCYNSGIVKERDHKMFHQVWGYLFQSGAQRTQRMGPSCFRDRLNKGCCSGCNCFPACKLCF